MRVDQQQTLVLERRALCGSLESFFGMVACQWSEAAFESGWGMIDNGKRVVGRWIIGWVLGEQPRWV